MAVQTYRPTLNSGQVYLKNNAIDGPKIAIGNVSELTLAISEEDKSLTDYTAPGGGQWAALSRITGIEATMKLHDLDPVNLARGLYGDASATVGGSITDESHTAYQGGLIRLTHPNPTSVTVTSDPAGTTYTADTDYEVRPEGIFILEGTIADDTDILISYTYAGYDVVEALTSGSGIYELSFGGLNEANSNSPVIVDIWRLQISATASLPFISDDFAALDVTGKVLQDSTKTGSGTSKYFRVQMSA